MSTPLVSICLPNLNHRRFLEERMATILAQTVTDWELIICDSYSDDGSWEFFQKFKDDPRIRMYQVPRAGLYAGWNECLRRTSGEFCYVATSDDTMHPSCIEKLSGSLTLHTEVDVAVCGYQEINEDSAPLINRPRPLEPLLKTIEAFPCIRDGKADFLLHAINGWTIWVTMTSVLFRRRLLTTTGYFLTNVGVVADDTWSLRAALASDIAFIPEKLATWRIRSDQATRQQKNLPLLLYQSLQSVLRARDSGIPDLWRQCPDWMDRIGFGRRMRFRDECRLNRWHARQCPSGFFQDLWTCLHNDPDWIWEHLKHGFGEARPDEMTPCQAATQLMSCLHVTWPPIRYGRETNMSP